MKEKKEYTARQGNWIFLSGIFAGTVVYSMVMLSINSLNHWFLIPWIGGLIGAAICLSKVLNNGKRKKE